MSRRSGCWHLTAARRVQDRRPSMYWAVKLLVRHRLSDLVPGCKERAVRERADQDGGYGDAPQEHVEDDDLKPHGFQRVRAGDDHADHRARQEDDPGRLRGVYEGYEGALEGRLEDGGCGLAARCTEGQSGLDFGPLLSDVVPDASQSQAGGVHGVPDRHAPERDQVAHRRWYYTEREQQPERRHGRHPHGPPPHPAARPWRPATAQTHAVAALPPARQSTPTARDQRARFVSSSAY